MATTFILLGLAILAVWMPPLRLGALSSVPAWGLLLAVACVAGVVQGFLAWPALVAIALLVACAYGSVEAPQRGVRTGLTVAAGGIALTMALHRVPGFANPILYDGVRVGAGGVAFTQYLNFDKGAAGLVLLAFYGKRMTRLERPVLRVALVVAAATAVVALAFGLVMGYLGPDLKLPAIAMGFLATNLLFTCVAEEAFFRGLVQEPIARGLQKQPAGRWIAVAVSALLFGLVHAAGGPTFVALATVGGIGYATAYALTGRIEAAILAHFTVNAIHFLGFTYPYLAR